jgi:two-component system, OmpR family, response regulator ChvI
MPPTAAYGAYTMHAANTELTETIVIVDDDALLRRTMAANLEDVGYRPASFDGGRAALQYFTEGGRASAVLLDWHMPEVDGPEVLRQLRANGHDVPVIFLTGHNQPIYEEAALAGGAVDFVDKSKSFSIILQRLKLALAGAKGGSGPAAEQAVAGITFDNDSARAFWQGRQVDLTLSEFKVVKLLVAKAGHDVSYREIYDLVRGEGFQAGAGEEGYRANVRAIVKRIRQKFRDTDANFDSIENYPGFGYRWTSGGRP